MRKMIYATVSSLSCVPYVPFVASYVTATPSFTPAARIGPLGRKRFRKALSRLMPEGRRRRRARGRIFRVLRAVAEGAERGEDDSYPEIIFITSADHLPDCEPRVCRWMRQRDLPPNHEEMNQTKNDERPKQKHQFGNRWTGSLNTITSGKSIADPSSSD